MRLLINEMITVVIPLFGVSDEGKEYKISRYNDALQVCKRFAVYADVHISTGWIRFDVYQQKIDLDEIAMNQVLDALTEFFNIDFKYVPRGEGCEVTLQISNADPVTR